MREQEAYRSFKSHDTRPVPFFKDPKCSGFHLFPQLPFELRAKIWSYCLPPPRVLTIQSPSCTCIRLNCPLQHRYHCTRQLPILLFVNHESRSESLQHYIIIHVPENGIAIAFDTKHDTVYFRGSKNGSTQWPSYFLDTELRQKEQYRIRKLVIDEINLEKEIYLREREESYLALEEIIILLTPTSAMYSMPASRTEWVRSLIPGERIEHELGWGWPILQEKFLIWLKELKERSGSGCGDGPVVKLAQSAYFVGNDMWTWKQRRWDRLS